jgi:hypothetical protein
MPKLMPHEHPGLTDRSPLRSGFLGQGRKYKEHAAADPRCTQCSQPYQFKMGVYKNMAASNYGAILKYEGRDEANIPTYSMMKVKDAYPTKTYDTYLNINQCWMLQVGLRYIFN